MRVRLLTGRAGPLGSHDPGEVIEVSDEDGRRMIAAGQCIREPAGKRTRKAGGRTVETTALDQEGEARG